MRKTSQDGGDSTSITSGIENEIKKSILKPKKTSLKRKPPNFSHDSDDPVIEPLLQKDRDKPETIQSAKFTKGKTDTTNDKGNDKSKQDNKTKTSSTTEFCGTTESLLSTKDYEITKTTTIATAPLHNYMNTNIFHTYDNSKANVTTKRQMLLEIDGTKQSGYNPNPLIFTTAKIHTDDKSKHMEPVQVTPVPILSTIEVSVSKGGSVTTNEKKVGNGTSVVNSVYSHSINDKSKDERGSNKSTTSSIASNKDITLDANANTSVNKILNNTSVPSTNENIVIPKPLSTVSNNKEKPSTSKKEVSPIVITQPLFKSFNTDGSKNNVTVKTSNALSGQNPQELSTMLNTNKNNSASVPGTELTNKKSKEAPKHSTNNVKSPVTGEPNVLISTVSICANKQLQRQKTLSDDTSAVDSKKQNIEDISDKAPLCAILSSTSKTIDSNLRKDDKSRKSSISAHNIDTKSSFNTTALPTSAPSSTTSSTNSTSTTLANESSIVNNIAKTVSLGDKTSSKTTTRQTTTKSDDWTPPAKTDNAKTSSNASAKTTSTSQLSGKASSLITKPVVVTTTAVAVTSESPSILSNKSTVAKPPATSTKIYSNDKSTPSIKSPLDITTTKGTINTKPPVSTVSTMMKSPLVTTANTKSIATSSLTKASPDVNSAQMNMIQSITSTSTSDITKSSSVTTSGKSSLQSSLSAVSTTPPVKPSQTTEVKTKPSTLSENKIPIVSTSSKTTGTRSIITSAAKITPKSKENIKESIVKASTPITSKALPAITRSTATTSTSVSTPVTTISTNKPPATNSKATSRATLVPTKTASASLSNSSIAPETSTKPKIVDTTQSSTKKPEGTISTSTTVRPSPKLSEPIKKGSKSNEPKTDGKFSKAQH